ncbi:MAG: transglycosylase domain-containing protein [Clostridia bacterium]|nr:transglycosylase domain-containing protein [Clostridia bacterium]
MSKKKNKRVNKKKNNTNKNAVRKNTTKKEETKVNQLVPVKKKEDNEKTKKVKKVKDRKKKDKKKKEHKILKWIIRIILTLILVGILVIGGVVAGVAMGVLGGDDFKITQEDLIIGTSNTVVLDKDGNTIATLAGDEKREIVTLSEMPAYLPEAFISIEDERFREHSGVDLKRTLYAAAKFVLNRGSSSFGGSTITQQLVKNITKDKEDEGIGGILRKIREWVKAYKIEEFASKDQILETYLNILSMGGGSKNIHGVQLGAKYYFNKNVGDLSLEEAAFLAGINHAPNTYNPFKDEDEEAKAARMEKINKRTKVVLSKMLELGKISQEEKDAAYQKVDEGLNFSEGSITQKVYSYYIESMVDEIVNELVEKNDWDEDFARTKLKSGGYIIYSNQDTKIQEKMEEEFAKEKYQIQSKLHPEKHSQAAMVVIENHTGYVSGVVGKLGEKTDVDGFNFATDGTGKQTGSAMKPLAVIAPAIEAGIITAGSVYDDVPTTFAGMKKDWPKNYDNTYKGLSTVRYTIEISHNIAPVAILSQLGTAKAVKFLRDIGFEYIDPEKDQNLALALGGLTHGATPLQMTAGYSMIANGGEYVEPTFFTKIVDANGNTILESEQTRRRVMSESNAYIMQNILFQPVVGPNGTAKYCGIKGFDIGAKTGTTNGDCDRWLCGFSPYYSAVVWYGFEENELVKYRGSPSNPSGALWDPIMEFIHKDLEPKRFDVPSDIKKVTICKDSGKLVGEYCTQDPRGNRTYTEVYVNGTQPTEKCTCHVKLKVCEEGGTTKLANDNCPNAVEKVFITRKDSEKNESWRRATDATYMAPTETCTTHTKKEESKVDNKVDNKVNNKVDNKVENKVENKVDNKVDNKVENKVENKVDNKVENKVTNTVSNTVSNTVEKPSDNNIKNVVDETKNTITTNANVVNKSENKVEGKSDNP